MPQFRFRLENVLKVRTAERQQRRAELADAFRAEQVIAEQLDQLEQERKSVKLDARTAAAPGELNVDQLMDGNRYELVLRARIAGIDQQLMQVRQEVERRRELLVEADKQVRVLEKLRDRQRAAHEQQEQNHETKRLDEAAQHVNRRSELCQ